MIANYLGCLRRYALFKGRTSKEQYRDFLYVLLLGGCISLFIWQLPDWGNFSIGNPFSEKSWKTYPVVYISLAAFILHLLPLITASTRRLQDAGYKKRAIFLVFIPVLGWLLLSYLLSRNTHIKFFPKNNRKPHILQEIHHPLSVNMQHPSPVPYPGTAKKSTENTPSIQAIYDQEWNTLSQSDEQGNNLSAPSIGPRRYAQQQSVQPNPSAHSSAAPSVSSTPAISPSSNEATPFMSLLWTDLYITGIEKYGNFSGRAKRKEYWTFILFVCLFWLIPLFLDGLLGWTFSAPQALHFLALSVPDLSSEGDLNVIQNIFTLYDQKLPLGYLSTLYIILSIVPLLSVQSRRINDTGRNGRIYLFWLIIPFIGIPLFFLLSLSKSKYSGTK